MVARPATTARDEILPRIADALADVPVGEQPGDVAVPRRYERGAQGDIVEQFVERVSEYARTAGGSPGPSSPRPSPRSAASAGSCGSASRPTSRPHGFRAGVEAQAAERLDPRALDTLGAALTGCALAIAETGTIVLDTGPRQGPRTLSLVPDHHLCVVDEADRGRVPEAMSSIARTIVRPVAR